MAAIRLQQIKCARLYGTRLVITAIKWLTAVRFLFTVKFSSKIREKQLSL